MLQAITKPSVLLRIEGATVLVAAIAAYWQRGENWLLFALLILAPDLSMLGYLAGTRVGATAYNLVHNYLLPAILAAYALATGSELALSLAVIWFAHIGGDRLLGFGLKYPTVFQDTHLSHV